MRRLATIATVLLGCLLPFGADAAGQATAPVEAVQEVRDTVPVPVPIPDEAVASDTLPAAADPEAAVDEPERDTSPDEVIQALRRLEGFQPVEYTAEEAEFFAPERELRLYRSPMVERGRDRIEAEDSLVYREQEQRVAAHGSPRATGEQGTDVVGDLMLYDLRRGRALVQGGRTRIAEAGAEWYVSGDEISAEGRERLLARGSTYTTDDRPEPQYHFQSDRVLVLHDRILVGRPARLYFRNVPVAWLPFIVQDLTRGRRSGLLTPEFGINDIVRTSSPDMGARGGTGRQLSNLGFYWAISDYMDARVAGEWRSGVSTGLTGALRYNWRRQFLTGDLTVNHNWQDGDLPNVLQLNASNSWQPTERTNMRANINYVSQSSFVRETNPHPDAAMQTMRSNLSADHRFDWGRVNLTGSRRHSLADDAIEMTLPRIAINPNPITLFRARGPTRWYNNANYSISGSGERTIRDPGQRLGPANREITTTRGSATQNFQIGNLTWNTSGQLRRDEAGTFSPSTGAGDDPFLRHPDGWGIVGRPGGPTLLDGAHVDDGSWQSTLSYRIGLIGSTSVSPNLSMSQEIRSDTVAGGQHVFTPTRIGFGSSLDTDLFGFFPGIGGFSAIRHRISPQLTYRYEPAVEFDERQRRAFGERDAQERNRLMVTVNQTIEGRPRRTRQEERPAEEAADDLDRPPETIPDLPETDPEAEIETEGDVAPAADVDAPATEAPQQPQPITLLGIQTSAVEYDFARARMGQPGLVTRDLTTSITSDYLRGLRLNFRHELFDGSLVDEATPDDLGPFSPRLTSFNTEFRLGPTSPPVEFLLGLFGHGTGSRRDASVGDLPADQDGDAFEDGDDRVGADLGAMNGMPTATGAPQSVGGGGPWSVGVRYTFSRRQRAPLAEGQRPPQADQSVMGDISFSPTPNWTVNWSTGYSIQDRSFDQHQFTLRRDLYRWEANFSFIQSPYGASLFSVAVRLKDLPDLRFEHREQGLGAPGAVRR